MMKKNNFFAIVSSFRLLIRYVIFFLLFSIIFTVINFVVLDKEFIITNQQEYFIEMRKNWNFQNSDFKISGYWNFVFTIIWGIFSFGFSKLKSLERHDLVLLSPINFFAVLMGIAITFYLNSILFGFIAYLAFVLLYFTIVLLIEINDIIWEILFPD